MERTVKVTGTGRLSVSPDTIRLPIAAEGTLQEYAEAVKRSSEDTASVREALMAAGLDPKDLKTVSYGVNTVYESVQTEKGEWKQVFAGYRYEHRMVIRFPLDNERLALALEKLAACPARVTFTIEHTVRDPEKVRNRLLKRAVSDSRKKAETLAAAAGVELGEVLGINYSWGEVEIVSRPMNRVMMAKGMAVEEACGFDMSIEPEDISVEDTVTVIWTIR